MKTTPMLLAASLALAHPVGAATLCVNPGGTGGCFASLQAAVDASQAHDVIDVGAGTYLESVAIPEKAKLTIQGAGPGSTVLDCGGPAVGFRVEPRSRVTLSGLAVRDCSVGISADVASRVVVSDCLVEDSTIGISFFKSRGEIANCVVRNNSTTGVSGGFKSRLTMDRCTLEGNGTSNADHHAGLLFSGAKAEVSNSTINGNTRGVVGDSITLRNCTVHDNRRPPTGGSGGGVAGTRLTILSTTITGNFGFSGGGLRVFDGKTKLANTIIANNTAFSGGNHDCQAPDGIRSRGFNLIRNPSGCVLKGKVDSVSTGVDPMLGPLAANGGPTRTRALLAGSPAIDSGDPRPATGKSTTCTPGDQRGFLRNGRCDIGAYEFMGTSPSGAFLDGPADF